ncbi:four helix bundle protein [Thermophagus xiamenensis]|uniref:Four helix bundle protein n=1 Tax=Thermophagus xiamenensis TaxID=385682 RepID=A0A1I2EU31_9BACT|nr:four helix bundle protein [Thermophagus xiamenensis]SFE96117.1 four helix bundle protein [Thermophagus xiamenensis]
MENFSFKNLRVWQKAMHFAERCLDIAEGVHGHYRLVEQLEAAASSIPQNIAEGEGRISNKEKINYLYFARGSLFEAITVLNLFYYKKLISSSTLDEMEELGIEISKMINSLIAQKRKFNSQ